MERGITEMADGRWVMTDRELNSTACGFERRDTDSLPNFGEHIKVDDRNGDAPRTCAFCGSDKLEAGFGGYGQGFGYKSSLCSDCGGTTDFVYKDDVGKFFDRKK
ncbi:MAG: hypothetical protein ACI4KJ_06630 [Anaerovoracaceae bacterium]